MDFLVLGPLEVRDGDRRVPLGGGQARKLLGILLVHANEVVASEQLIDALWEGNPPETAAKALQGLVAQLRKLLTAGLLVTEPPGYVLRVGPDRIDAKRFTQLIEDADGSPPREAAAKLREALALRRGRPFADFAYDEFARQAIVRLEELELAALEARIEADLELGRHPALAGELDTLVAAHPLRERLRGQQMLALYRSGRQADALAAYRNARETLVEELGLEPSEELQQLQKRILAHDPRLLVPRPEAPGDGASLGERTTPKLLLRPRVFGPLGALLLIAAVVAIVEATTRGSSSPVLVRTNSVAVIDPSDGRVVSDIAVGTRPVAVAVGDSAVWAANADDGTVSRIDPKTREAVSTIGIGGDVSDVAIGFGSVWIAGGNDGTLTRIDPKLNAVEATLRLGRPRELSPQPVFAVAVGEGSVWATRGNSVLKIDPATNQTVARIPVSSPLAIAVGGGSLWVTTSAERILRIDAASNILTARAALPSQGTAAVWQDGLWMIISVGQGNVWHFDPNSLTPTSTFTTATGAIDLAAGEGAVWSANSMGSVWRIEPSSGRVTKIALGHHPTGIASGDGAVWVAIA